MVVDKMQNKQVINIAKEKSYEKQTKQPS